MGKREGKETCRKDGTEEATHALALSSLLLCLGLRRGCASRVRVLVVGAVRNAVLRSRPRLALALRLPRGVLIPLFAFTALLPLSDVIFWLR